MTIREAFAAALKAEGGEGIQLYGEHVDTTASYSFICQYPNGKYCLST